MKVTPVKEESIIPSLNVSASADSSPHHETEPSQPKTETSGAGRGGKVLANRFSRDGTRRIAPELHGTLSDDLLEMPIEIASGNGCKSKHFVNTKLSIREVIADLKTLEIGYKDGHCILQGSTAYPQRSSQRMVQHSIMLIDVDTGCPVDEIIATLKIKGLAAVIWTTHSHMKCVTELPMKTLNVYAHANNLKLGFDPEVVAIHARDYLLNVKKIRPEILKDVSGTWKNDVYTIQHQPMPRFRIMLFLSKQFVFGALPHDHPSLRARSSDRAVVEKPKPTPEQLERIATWKRSYKAVADSLGVTWDEKCVDPARLMYTPRVEDEAAVENYRFIVIGGTALDLKDFPIGENNTGGGASKRTGGTKGRRGGGTADNKAFASDPLFQQLVQFAGKCPDFDASGWFQSVDGGNVVNESVSGGSSGHHHVCPNEHNHTQIKEGSTAFVVKIDADNAWWAGCQHQTCTSMSGGDRLWYVWTLMKTLDLTDLTSLEAFSPTAVEANAALARKSAEHATAWGAAETLARDEKALGKALKKAKTPAQIKEIVDALATLSDGDTTVDQTFTYLKKEKRATAATLKTQLKAVRKAYLASVKKSTPVDVVDYVNSAPAIGQEHTAPTVRSEWHHNDQVRVAKAHVVARNKKELRIFRDASGACIHIKKGRVGSAAGGVGPHDDIQLKGLTRDGWDAELGHLITFHKRTANEGDKGRPLPLAVAAEIRGDVNLDFPKLTRVTDVPHHSSTGVLRTQPGYDADTATYLVPGFEIKSPPAVGSVTPAHIAEAIAIYHDCVRDFPFSDSYSGSETLPVYTSAIGDDGHRIPNHACPLSYGAISSYVNSHKELGHDTFDAGRSVA